MLAKRRSRHSSGGSRFHQTAACFLHQPDNIASYMLQAQHDSQKKSSTQCMYTHEQVSTSRL
jgi:hypothetical protein